MYNYVNEEAFLAWYEEKTGLKANKKALLQELANHGAFNEDSLTDARAIADVVVSAAKTVAGKAAAAEQAALEKVVLPEEIEDDEEREAAYTAALEHLTEMGALTEAWKDLKADALAEDRKLDNIFVDVPARSTDIVIGEIEGELYLNNEGDIHVLVDSGREITSLFDEDPGSHIQIFSTDPSAERCSR